MNSGCTRSGLALRRGRRDARCARLRCPDHVWVHGWVHGFGGERGRQASGVVVLRHVVQVPHRRLDVRVPHPLLDLHQVDTRRGEQRRGRCGLCMRPGQRGSSFYRVAVAAGIEMAVIAPSLDASAYILRYDFSAGLQSEAVLNRYSVAAVSSARSNRERPSGEIVISLVRGRGYRSTEQAHRCDPAASRRA